jgi:hypothetical protein
MNRSLSQLSDVLRIGQTGIDSSRRIRISHDASIDWNFGEGVSLSTQNGECRFFTLILTKNETDGSWAARCLHITLLCCSNIFIGDRGNIEGTNTKETTLRFLYLTIAINHATLNLISLHYSVSLPVLITPPCLFKKVLEEKNYVCSLVFMPQDITFVIKAHHVFLW